MNLTRETELLGRITSNPAILGGKPVIRGLRFSVQQLVTAVAAGVPETDLLADFPFLEPDDIRAALLYAAKRVAEEEVWPVLVA
ncbi:MAG: DUF433 domain-containing protein [Undibacterium sp.]|nr:DUF433 domain-containing protein [Opitutaceae bacterium]